jgi:dihydrofolate reductase
MEQALSLARTFAAERGVGEIMIIGGAEVFRASLPWADRVYLTIVHGRPEGDVTLGEFDPQVWLETFREALPQTPRDQFPADFVVLDRKR